MTAAIRWTPEQLAEYERRRAPATILPAPAKRLKTPKLARKASAIEELMAEQLAASSLPPAIRQYRYLPDRKFAGDFCWPDRKIALEVDGGVHRVAGRFAGSFERDHLLRMAGWEVCHVGSAEVRSGKALEWIRELLARATGGNDGI